MAIPAEKEIVLLKDPSKLKDEDWKKRLTPEQYEICRLKGTEAPGSGAYEHFKGKGTYHCVACGHPLFDSMTKFDSGSGWPSFWKPLGDDAVAKKEDRSWTGRLRIEILCKRCDSHLGHVFDDGPDPTGLRYCINSRTLQFASDPAASLKTKKGDPAPAKP